MLRLLQRFTVTRTLPFLFALSACLAAARPASARPLEHVEATLGGALTRPAGVLGAVADHAPAGWLAVSARTDSAAWFALRLEGGFTSLRVGEERALLAPSGGPSTSFATVSQRMLWFTLGPEVSVRAGATRLYAWAGAGLGSTGAHASVRTAPDSGAYFPESFNDPPGRTTFAWTMGAGARIPVAGGFALDLSGAFVGLGRSPIVSDPPLTADGDRREQFVTTTDLPSLALARVGVSYSPPAGHGRAVTAPAPHRRHRKAAPPDGPPAPRP